MDEGKENGHFALFVWFSCNLHPWSEREGKMAFLRLEFERTDDVIGVIRKFKKRAENIFQQEKRLEEERLEREHCTAGETTAKTEAEAANKDPVDAMVIPPDLMDIVTNNSVTEEKTYVGVFSQHFCRLYDSDIRLQYSILLTFSGNGSAL